MSMSKATRRQPVEITWVKREGAEQFTTRAVDPRSGRVYLGAWLPRAMAERMGMTSFSTLGGQQ